MKVFKIRPASNVYQSALPSDIGVHKTELLRFDCDRRLENWVPPEIYIYNPKKKRGNFLQLTPGSFLVDEMAKELLLPILEMAGELLPIPHKDELFFALNVLECINCLNENNTKWIVGAESKKRIGIERYDFYRDRFSESSIFKIPEQSSAWLFAVSGLHDPENDFKLQVEAHGLTGLEFEEVWSIPG
jgi:hypothetical protein